MSQDIYEIHFKNGQSVKLAGSNFTEAFKQTGLKTPDGNIDFSTLDYYFHHVQIVLNAEEIEPEYFQIYLKKDKNSGWKSFGKPFKNVGLDSLETIESVMIEKVKREGFVSGLVVRDNDGKVLSWKCADDLTVGIYPTIRTIELQPAQI